MKWGGLEASYYFFHYYYFFILERGRGKFVISFLFVFGFQLLNLMTRNTPLVTIALFLAADLQLYDTHFSTTSELSQFVYTSRPDNVCSRALNFIQFDLFPEIPENRVYFSDFLTIHLFNKNH